MKKTFALIATLAVMALASQAFAQNTNSRIVTKVTTQQHDRSDRSSELGRDFWFAPAQNYIDEPGKYIRLYITSPNQTIAHVECQGVKKSVPIPAFGVGTFDVPLTWEMKSSGVPEDKAIHVYDNTDDIAVYLMSHEPYSSDGMRCIPTIGWGTDYVVASFGSLYQGPDAFEYDLPSEFTISADQDNTIVDITPWCDLRQANNYSQNDIFTAYPKGVKFEVTLNRGQSVQYQSIVPGNTTDFDVTGTVIHSNVGIGVVGATMCADIPQGFDTPDYICDMIPPVRAWGKTYYTTNPIQPQGMSGHDFSLYCLISTVPNQEIDRTDALTGKHTEAILGPIYDHYFVEEESANNWTSSAPFLLVQYLNSSTYPDNVTGNGNPAECAITPEENFTRDVVFVTPGSSSGEAPFDNYANIIVNVKDERNVTFDGKKITANTHQPIDGEYDAFIIPHITPAAHVVKSDSGVAVYQYGYGSDESYLWGGGFGNNTFNSPDTVPPKVIIRSECFLSNIHISDSGFLPGSTSIHQSELNEIRLDSDVNMAYLPWPYPEWVDGGLFDTSGVSMYVVDESKPAILIFDVFDAAGNRTTVTSTYTPQIADIEPPLQNFGAILTGTSAVAMYDTIWNTGQVPFKYTQLNLLYGDRGFSLDSTYAFPVTIPVNGFSLIKIKFFPVQLTSAIDSLIFGDPCFEQEVGVIGSGGAPDFYVSDVIWQNVPAHPVPAGNWTVKGAIIHNLSKIGPINVSPHFFAPGWPDSTAFALMSGQRPFPRTIPAGGTDTVWFYFIPFDLNSDTAQLQWTAPEVLALDGSGKPIVKLDKLIGNAITSSLVFGSDTTITIDCSSPVAETLHLFFRLTNTGTQGAVIDRVHLTNPAQFTNLTGHDQSNGTWDPTIMFKQIQAGEVLTFTVDFPVTPNTNEAGTTQIYAIDGNGDTVQGGRINAAVYINYREAVVAPTTIPFGPVAYKSGKVSGQFAITNPASSNLTIYDIEPTEGGKYNSSYLITGLFDPVTNAMLSLPYTIPAGNFINVQIDFDPSVSKDPEQNTSIDIFSNACSSQRVSLNGQIIPSSGVTQMAPPLSSASVIALDDARSIRVTIPPDWTPQIRLDIYDILGENIFTTSLGNSSTFDLGLLPRGVYFYRLRFGLSSQTGKIIMGE